MKKSGKGKFVFSDTGRACTVQDALFHYFGVPIHVVAKPAAWYARHRKPCIVECSVDRTRVLVSFTASNMYGEEFGGSCLYLLRGEEWEAYTIRPNRSNDIRSAEAWLIKRRWEQW